MSDSYRDIAKRWWESRAPGGAFHKDSPDVAGEDLEKVTALEDSVEELTENPETLGALLEALVATAPEESRQAYIGTWHLENAYQVLGLRVFQILDSTRLDPMTKQRILSGFRF